LRMKQAHSTQRVPAPALTNFLIKEIPHRSCPITPSSHKCAWPKQVTAEAPHTPPPYSATPAPPTDTHTHTHTHALTHTHTQQTRTVREVFDGYDLNRDGFLDQAEQWRMLKDLFPGLTLAEHRKLFAAVQVGGPAARPCCRCGVC